MKASLIHSAAASLLGLTLLFAAACSGDPGIRVRSSGAAPVDSTSGSATQHNGHAVVDWPALDRWTTTRDAPNDVAVIVAIEDYAFLPDIPGARRNATDWEMYFRSRGMRDIYLITDGDAAAEEMERYANIAANAAKRDSTVWYVFVGHGAPARDGTDGVLVGMDARQTPDSLASRGVRQSELVSALEKGNQKNTVMIVDACFSGRSQDGDALAVGTQPVIAVSSQAALAPTTTILSAAKADQFAGSLPGAARPAFSYLLLGALRGWADDGDGAVTTREAHDWVARQLRHVRGRTQTPEFVGANLQLTRTAREKDPGIGERMRQAASGAIVVEEADATRIDTGGAVTVTQIGGWIPGELRGSDLTALESASSSAIWKITGWHDVDGNAEEWIADQHKKFSKLERQVRAPQRIKYGSQWVQESEYEATSDGVRVRIYFWDVVRDRAYYRAIGYTTDPAIDYPQFQKIMKGLRFSPVTTQTLLVDATPNAHGKVSDEPVTEQPNTPTGTTPIESGRIDPPSGPGWSRNSAEENQNIPLFYEHQDSSAFFVAKITYDDAQSARADSEPYWNRIAEGQPVTVRTRSSIGGHTGWYGEQSYQTPNPQDPRFTVAKHQLIFQRISGRTMWLFVMFTPERSRNTHINTFIGVLESASFQ